MSKRERRTKMKAHKEQIRKKEYDEKSCKCKEDHGFASYDGYRICSNCHLIIRPKGTPNRPHYDIKPGCWTGLN